MSIMRALASGASAYLYYQAFSTFRQELPTAITGLYGSYLIFLTLWALLLAIVQASIATLGHLTNLRTVKNLAAWLLQISAPLSTVIALLYWPVWAIDPTLLLDTRFNSVLPLKLDMGLHLWPAILQSLAAIYVPPKRFTSSAVQALLTYSVLAFGYWKWIHITKEHNGFLPYPMLDDVPVLARASIFGVFVLVLVLVRGLLAKLQR